MQERHPTAQRIIAAALALFAEHGMEATPIVRIEADAGLAPGSGAFYKHFKSKADVLRAARADMASNIPEGESFQGMAGLDVRTQLTLIASGMLAGYDAHRNLVLAGLRLPTDHQVFDDKTSISDRGVTLFESWLTAQQASGVAQVDDPRSTATLLLGGLFSYWLSEQLSVSGSLDIERRQIVTTWVELAIRAVRAADGS